MKVLKSFLWLTLFIGCLVLNLNIANALSIVHPDNGLYFLRPECALDKVLSVQDASKNWGANVIIDNSNSNASTWKLTKVDGDWYTITAVHSDLSLNVADTQTSTAAGNGFNVSTTSYRGENQNKFRFFDAGNGYYVIQAQIPGNYVLDVYYGYNQSGNNVWCYAFNNTPAQKWKLENRNSLNDPLFQQRTVTISDGWYRIQPMHDLERSVDSLGSQIGNGNNIHMWTTVEASQQKFYLQNRGNGYFSLQSAYSKLFVTANGRGNGANLYTDYWNNSDSQLFRLVDTGDNSYHIFSKVGINLNFDCAGGGKSDGNNVQLWTTENNDWHKWKFTKVSVENKASFQMESYNLSCPADHQLKFTGRLWNANNNSEITGIHVYIGGGAGAGGQFIGEFSANKPNHSFDHIIDVPKSRNGNQLIVIYAVNGVESKELDRRYISLSQTYTPSGDLQSLISSFTNPPRQKWDNRESNRLGKTCFGFANYIFRELHGVIAASSIDWSNAYILENLGAGVSCRYSGSVNENTLHTIFQQCTPGDFIQSTRNDGTGQHSMIFVSYDANARKVRIFDANFTTDHDNLIQDRNPTVHQFFTRFQKMSVYTK